MKNNDLRASDVALFAFDSHDVRAINKDGEAWFVATDVATTLGYRDAHDASRHLDEDEKGTHILCTLGGEQSVTIINESGIYALVLRSRKPDARRFRKWVTREVLPSIRKTGEYVNQEMKSKIAYLQETKEVLRSQLDEVDMTLRCMGTTYLELYRVENAILRSLTMNRGGLSTTDLESSVRSIVKCSTDDYWSALTDMHNRYKIHHARSGRWELTR